MLRNKFARFADMASSVQPLSTTTTHNNGPRVPRVEDTSSNTAMYSIKFPTTTPFKSTRAVLREPAAMVGTYSNQMMAPSHEQEEGKGKSVGGKRKRAALGAHHTASLVDSERPRIATTSNVPIDPCEMSDVSA